MTENDLDLAILRKEARDEVRLVLATEARNELTYLIDGSTEEPTDLSSVLLLAWEARCGRAVKASDDVCCEGKAEGEEWAFYVHGFTVDELLPLVWGALPDGWTVSVAPVPGGVHSGAQIAVTRRRGRPKPPSRSRLDRHCGGSGRPADSE